ncbi:hypothetical protein HELRODRAFT_132965, partial [Helobdella robusta]|uniref:Kinesin-like protein n=1 Tax=Helobdella robusta TaxID=6412 RepID=T1EI01_HELRO
LDRVYDKEQKTKVIFDELISPIMQDIMSGINGTIFAYGQTSSGKTYTMMGDETSPGIISMCIKSIYNKIENTPSRAYFVRVSYVELYNENIVDLLSDSKKVLALGENFEGDVIVKELKEELVQNCDDCMELLKRGEKERHYGSTNMNEKSSRSHVFFRVIIESRDRDETEGDAAFFVSQLYLIDLAGSEKLKQTGNVGQRATEGGFINKSLLTLSQVISQLSSNSRFICLGFFVSYRDSKLTRILQNSLGGNSKTVFICTVTPVAADETLSTLRFATKVKCIKNRPVINE